MIRRKAAEPEADIDSYLESVIMADISKSKRAEVSGRPGGAEQATGRKRQALVQTSQKAGKSVDDTYEIPDDNRPLPSY